MAAASTAGAFGPERIAFLTHDQAAPSAGPLFATVRRRLVPLLPHTTRIEHVGATAIPGCITKGDLDIAVRVPAALFETADTVLGSLYDRNCCSSDRSPTFAAFLSSRTCLPLAIQLVAKDGPEDTLVRFRDLLRSRPDLVQRYNEFKKTHARWPVGDYGTAKARFVRVILAQPPAD